MSTPAEAGCKQLHETRKEMAKYIKELGFSFQWSLAFALTCFSRSGYNGNMQTFTFQQE